MLVYGCLRCQRKRALVVRVPDVDRQHRKTFHRRPRTEGALRRTAIVAPVGRWYQTATRSQRSREEIT
jgi:hypothetical protein